MAAILYRYAQYKKYNTAASSSLNGFTDYATVSGYAVTASLQWAVAEKLVNGNAGKLMPTGNATRAQVAAIPPPVCGKCSDHQITPCSTGLPPLGGSPDCRIYRGNTNEKNQTNFCLDSDPCNPLTLTVPALAASGVQNEVQGSAAYMVSAVKSPEVGSIGGEWAIIGLARSGYTVPTNYYEDYYARVEKYVKNCSGVLHERKYTEYSRVILALTAIGRDPSKVAGYNLLMPLGDFEKDHLAGSERPHLGIDRAGFRQLRYSQKPCRKDTGHAPALHR